MAMKVTMDYDVMYQIVENRLKQLYEAWLKFKDGGEEYWKLAKDIKFSYEHEDYYWYRMYFSDCYVTFYLSKADKKLIRIFASVFGDAHTRFKKKSPDYEYIVKLQDMVYDLWDSGCLNYLYYVMQKNKSEKKIKSNRAWKFETRMKRNFSKRKLKDAA